MSNANILDVAQFEIGVTPVESVPSGSEMDSTIAAIAEQIDDIFTPEVVDSMKVPTKTVGSGDAGDMSWK